MAPKLAEEIAKLRKEVEQLRRENALDRIPTSEAVADLIAYVKENTKDEQLLRNHRNFKELVEVKRNHIQPPPSWARTLSNWTCKLY